MIITELPFRRRGFNIDRDRRFFGGSSSSASSNSSSATNTATDNSDNRQDNRVDSSQTDNSTHSQVSIDNSDHRTDSRVDNSRVDNSVATYQNDNRIDSRSDNSVSIDDHSRVSSVNNSDNRQDNRQDNSRTTVSTTDARVTNITTLDGAVAQSAIRGATDIAQSALSNANSFATQSTRLFEAAANFGDNALARSLDAQHDGAKLAYGLAVDALDNNLANSKLAYGFAGSALDTAAEFSGHAFDRATDVIAKGADADRAFAAQFLGNVFETQKSADQANTEKLVKAGTTIAVVGALAFAAVKIFAKKKAA